MNHHLKFISEEAGDHVHVVLVLDQAGWHMAKRLKILKNVTLLYLPAYSPELNPVERLWGYMKSHYLSNRGYKDYDDLFEEEFYNQVDKDHEAKAALLIQNLLGTGLTLATKNEEITATT